MAVYSLLFGHAEWPDDPTPARVPPAVTPKRERTARLTVHVPSTLKRRLDESAELAGLPPETFLERALARSVDPRIGAWT